MEKEDDEVTIAVGVAAFIAGFLVCLICARIVAVPKDWAWQQERVYKNKLIEAWMNQPRASKLDLSNRDPALYWSIAMFVSFLVTRDELDERKKRGLR